MPAAVALMSGGLDSMLAVKVILEQGITVTGINFSGIYCPRPLAGKSNAEKAAEKLGIELVTLPIDAEFIAMVKNPEHGRGKNMNPCIDCHTLMIRKAWEWGRGEVRIQKPETRIQSAGAGPQAERGMQTTSCGMQDGGQAADQTPNAERGTPTASFVITGEVLGQRPMSQNYKSLAEVAKDSGTEGRLLRPLSAKLLPETEPEQKGLVDRSRLLDIQGRSRKRQMDLARSYGIVEYPAPAGGCLLTEKVFSSRLADAFAHGEDSLELLDLLRFGRHFRLESGARVIVGRDAVENAELRRRAPDEATVVDGTQVPGPLCLLIPATGQAPIPKSQFPVNAESTNTQVEAEQQDDIVMAARICARYSDRRKEERVRVRVGDGQLEVPPASEDDTARLLIA